jgi:hypothetical protein
MLACHRGRATEPAAPEDSELRLAETVLSDFVGPSDSSRTLLLLDQLEARSREVPDSTAWLAIQSSWLRDRMAGREQLLMAFWRANRRYRRLTAPLNVPGSTVHLVSQPAMNQQLYPMVYIISRIGFTAGGDSALVSVDGVCGTLCGHGNLLLYTRDAAGWHRTAALSIVQY